MKRTACIFASAVLAALYAQGGPAWILGFILLVPWLLVLERVRTAAGTLACAWAMSVAFTAGGFAWFGAALGRYAQIGETGGIAVLLLAAPLFQPQFFAFAMVRHIGRGRFGPILRVLSACSAWIAAEWLLPRILGDSLGYGLYPSRLMRQAADLGGAAGLTLLLLLVNESVAAALNSGRNGWRTVARPLAVAALVPVLMALYGTVAMPPTPAAGGKPLRMGLIQSNLVDYEKQRREKGAYAFVRELLDRHFSMSYQAVTEQRAEALLWSETAYPTTFGNPKSEAGAEFDAEIRRFVDAAGVPLVFGTYDRDSAGEYNAAAFLQPGAGITGFYRKTHLFPFTEYLPAWLDGPLLRRLLPWSGNWKPGNGARVLPLRLAGGREIPVLPLICRDDVDAGLAIDGARLGAQVILTMSNDSWFSADGPGARLHLAAAAFRSIETRLPQFRVTSDGYSAVFDASGEILTATRVGEPALLIADVPLRSASPTLMVLWGDWVGMASAAFLIALAARAALRSWRVSGRGWPELARGPEAFPMRVYLLPLASRIAVGVVRAGGRIGLLSICLVLLLNESFRSNTLAQIRWFALLFLVPEVVSWCVLLAFSAQASVSKGKLVFSRGQQNMELALAEISAVQAWRLPLPGAGVSLRLASGAVWRHGLALPNPAAFTKALAAAGGPQLTAPARTLLDVYTQARLALGRMRLDHPLAKFVLLPLILAIPAFHLHQHIAYGSAFGEYYSFGLAAYLDAFALWWAAWTIGVVLGAALLRAVIEGATLLAAGLRPGQAIRIRGNAESAAHVALYVGLPAWLLWRIFGS
ncbi:apolipoprotein N-acyltransferase [Pseudoduganella violaceinigra]|uniref:apolipoprotein N-acyltransferase n=1 Tax=Pseudoduganella violaceinigra TaxID=246602 RepID=UPI000489FFE4|nr:apolipoprotein N-acyltransferase [Pseudoduganella violaceinigra]